MKKLFKMEQVDIDTGRRGSNICCPIARCLRRYGYDEVAVGWGLIHLTCYFDTKATTTRMKRFIDKFDKGSKVKPINFILDI